MISLALAAFFFIAIHIGVSGSRARDALVGRLGLRGYMVAFSVASVAAMAWLVASYKASAYLPTWGMLEWWKPVAIVLMLPAFLLVVIGLTTPNPTAVAQEKLVADTPKGIVGITRHPFLVGSALWAFVHVVGNGDWASLLLFGSLLIVAAAGTVSIDAKRRRVLGDAAWDVFARRTSIIPFAAVIAGRGAVAWRELGWWRILAGVVAYALMLGGHAHIVGISPWPVR